MYLLHHKDQYHWVCIEHSNPDKDGCHGVKDDHHRWIIWNEVYQEFTDSSLMWFLKRAANKWRKEESKGGSHNNRFFNHQQVKNLQSPLIYFSAAPREILYQRSKIPDEVKEK